MRRLGQFSIRSAFEAFLTTLIQRANAVKGKGGKYAT